MIGGGRIALLSMGGGGIDIEFDFIDDSDIP
jgi:hypothetical protein